MNSASDEQEPEVPAREPVFAKVVLHLVKGGAERAALEAGQVDAIIDPAARAAILLPVAQRNLLQRAARKRSLLALSCDWQWDQDAEHRFIAPGIERDERYGDGLGGDAIIGRTLWELVSEEPAGIDWKTHRQQLAWHVSFSELEIGLVDAQGLRRVFSFSGEPVFDQQQRFSGYRGIARELSAQRRRQAAQHDAGELARAALDALVLQVAVLDAEGVVISANAAWRACTDAGLAGAGVSVGGNFLSACDHAAEDGDTSAHAMAVGVRELLAGRRASFEHGLAQNTFADASQLQARALDGPGAARAVLTRVSGVATSPL